MTFKLTNENYFSKDRPHISNSAIGDYLKDPAFYKARHVDRTLIRKPMTPAMKKGSLVDALLTQPKNNPYQVKMARTVKAGDNREQYTLETQMIENQKLVGEDHIMTAAPYKEALEIAAYIKKQPFWKEGLKTAIFQEVLEGQLEDTLICGLPDRIDRIDEDNWHITDLKISTDREMNRWHWTALERGYYRQAAIYRYLWAELQGIPVEQVVFSHVVGTQIQEGLHKVKLYSIDASVMDIALEEVRGALKLIKKKKFKSKPVIWDNSEVIGSEKLNGM